MPDERPEGEGEVSEGSETLTPHDWATIGRDKKRRRELLARMFAINPHLVQERMAEQFQVNRDTISSDMQIIRAAAGERALDQVAEVGETFAALAAIRSGAMASAERVQVDTNFRPAYWNTALKAIDQETNVRFRLGYWTEAPKRVAVGGDSDAPPVKHEHGFDPDFVAETLAILEGVAAAGPPGSDPGGDPEADEVPPTSADA